MCSINSVLISKAIISCRGVKDDTGEQFRRIQSMFTMIVCFGRNERYNKSVCDIPMSSLGTNIF